MSRRLKGNLRTRALALMFGPNPLSPVRAAHALGVSSSMTIALKAQVANEKLTANIGRGDGAGPVKIFTAKERAALQAQMAKEQAAKKKAAVPLPSAPVASKRPPPCRHPRVRRDPCTGDYRCLHCLAWVDPPECEHGISADEFCEGCTSTAPLRATTRGTE